MKKQDKIIDLFRKNQHKLNERPSPQTWNKLERRLDQKNRSGGKPSTSIYRLFLMMAAAISLVFFVVTLSDIATTKATQKAEVIPENTQIKMVIAKQVSTEQAFREKYQEQLSKSIEEGSAERLLVANKAVRPFLIPRKS